MNPESLTADAQKFETVHCDRHGDRRKAYVCDHLLHGEKRGFFNSTDDPTNPHPDAWCSTCEGIKAAHGGEWNEKSEALITVRLVCGECYEEIRARNILGIEASERVH